MRDFALHRPASVAAAAAAFAGTDGEAVFIAGGHTLIPAMKSRLRMPDALVDLSGLGLSGLSVDGGHLWIGAMTTHADVAANATAIPGLAALAAGIGDAQVRNRGTIGGSLANNDPAADYPAAALALDAVIETDRGSHAADDFFQGMFSTTLADGEIITRVGFALPQQSSYAKFRHPASRYAMVGVYVARHTSGWRAAVTGAGPGVFRWTDAEAALNAGTDTAGLVLAADDLNSDIHASADYRAHLCGVMLKQALATLI
ncbi:FAD binding domain-containing protein [Sandarakinorhabdus sp.]|uniref:FAD binding domain-containing protein n=1 Tax=Sandarakinorhabdus sp. TaxID=1916663 RepID=UPI00286E5E26|nr:FAD binding domain-containing protein [Sandarakinorhabdus sp.]